MKLLRLTLRLCVTVLLFAPAAIVLTEAPASAGTGCSGGQVCIWGENSYTGCEFRATYSIEQYTSFGWQTCGSSINDGANAVKNRGNSCHVVMFEHEFRTGAAIRFNNPSSGGILEDPYLANGGGYSYPTLAGYETQNWQDRISSHGFCA